jgi:hypothetical protein
MERLNTTKKYAHWFEPLHDIAREQTGLEDFGADPSYQIGLRVLLSAMDDDCDLSDTGLYGAQLKLIHVLKQRLLAEQAFKDRPDVLGNAIVRPVVITGLVRTGSTALHYLMARDPGRQHLQYWLAENPMVRPALDTWSAQPGFQASRANLDMMFQVAPKLKAIHYMAADWPEECGHLLAHTFTDDAWPCTRSAPHYNAWYEGVDMVPSYRQHKKLLQLIGANEPDKPWLLKYPVHMKHLDSFLQVYPDAQVIWTHRDPAVVMSSYVSLIAGFRELSVRPETIDLDDILREQMEIWAVGAERGMAVRERYPAAQFYDVHFDQFMADPVAQVRKAYQHFGIDWTPACEGALQQWNEDNPQHKHGKHGHGDNKLALHRDQILERFAGYIDHFGVQVDRGSTA